MPATRSTSSAPARPFHGWVMLGLAIAMAFATMPGQTVLVSLWKEPIREALGLSLASVSAAYAIGTLLAALPLSLVGRVADRFGLRATVALVGSAFAVSLILLREASGIVTLGLGFFLVRFLGQGSLGMLAGHTLAMWFERRLGTVHGVLVVLGFAAGGALLPQPTAWLLAEHGWRATLLALAGMVAVLVLPGLLVFRNRPEELGQRLDGDREKTERHSAPEPGATPRSDPAFTARQAMRTGAFWILAGSLAATGLVGTALIFHMPAMLLQGGLEGSAPQAALAIQAWAIAVGAITLPVGWLVDRARPSRILVPGLLLMATGVALCLCAARGESEPRSVMSLMAAGMAVFGASQAVITGVAQPTLARYFGRTHHGAIRGTVATVSVLGTGAGPYLVALGHDLAAGDFAAPYLVCIALILPLGIGAALLKAPDRPGSEW